MNSVTHQAIEQSLCGTALELGLDFSRVELVALQCMAARMFGS
jgi:hypothetical protein